MLLKLVVITCWLCVVAEGATYNGKNIDGISYTATLKGKAEIRPVKIVFDGRSAFVTDGEETITLYLETEVIEDPLKIPAYDESGGWTITIDKL
jgi:hypothetical protein